MKRALSIFLLLALNGCYQLGEIRPTVTRSLHTLAIPTFHNSTLIPRTEALLADITIRMFQNDGTFEIVPENQADAILECKLVNVSRSPILSSTTNFFRTQQFQYQIQVTFQLVSRITGAVLLQGSANGTTTYFVGPDLVSDERQILPLAGRSMASSLVVQLTQGW